MTTASEGHIDSPLIFEETDILTIVGSYRRYNYDIFLLPLERIDCIDHDSFLNYVFWFCLGREFIFVIGLLLAFSGLALSLLFLLFLHIFFVCFFVLADVPSKLLLELLEQIPPLCLIGRNHSDAQIRILDEVNDESLDNTGLPHIPV